MNRKLSPRWLAAWIAICVFGGLYFSGNLDYLLYNVGLNYHECARNGYGATFCGGDLTTYQERFNGVLDQFQTPTITAPDPGFKACDADQPPAGCP